MLKKTLFLLVLIAFTATLLGCGIQNVTGGKSVPPLEGYSKIVIAPFAFSKSSGQYEDLPMLISYGIGTKLSLKFPDKKFFFDQTNDVKPVTDKINELGLNKRAVAENQEAASKLAKAFDADLIIVGFFDEPRFTTEYSSKIEEDKSKVSNIGALRYYSVIQTATLKSKVKVIDVTGSKELWNGVIYGYRRYITKYLTGESPKMQREDSMLADIRKDYVDNIVAKLYPERASK
jgi:hypothetical protein